MAPVSSADASSVPLADYFFISGIESSQVYDERSQPSGLNGLSSPLASPPPVDVDETIEEDRALETDSIRPKSQEGLSNGEGTKRRSARLSFEHRQSVGTIIGSDSKQSASNRSSATIKGIQVGASGLSEVDFENALRKFASERDTFLEEIQFSAGIAQQNRPTPTKPRARPQRVTQHEDGGGNLRSGVGSIRRRLSTMQSSLKRQSSMARQGKRERSAGRVNFDRLSPRFTSYISFFDRISLTWVQLLFVLQKECRATTQLFPPRSPSIPNRICILYSAVTNRCSWIATPQRTWSKS